MKTWKKTSESKSKWVPSLSERCWCWCVPRRRRGITLFAHGVPLRLFTLAARRIPDISLEFVSMSASVQPGQFSFDAVETRVTKRLEACGRAPGEC